MTFRLVLFAAVAIVVTGTVASGDGEKYELKERFAAGEVATVKAKLDMAMDITISAGSLERKMPVKFKDVQEYVQKVLAVDGEGRPAKVARHYLESAMETEKPDGTRSSGSTSFNRNTYIIEKTEEGVNVSKLGGDEVNEKEKKELGAAVTGNLHRILPGKEVEAGDSWDVPLEAVCEIYSIDQEVKGRAKATFTGVEEYREHKSAVVKIEVEIEVPQGAMTLKYNGQGKVYFVLEEKKIVGIETVALIEVSGSQKTGRGEVKYGGGGSSRTSFKSTPGKGEIDLTPPKKQEEKKEE